MPSPVRIFLACLVIASWFLIAAAVVALIVWSWPGVAGVLIGSILGVVVIALRPRLPRLEPDEIRIDRDDAPELFGLLDSIAEAIDIAPFEMVACGGEFSAANARIGLRQRRTVIIGLPLWTVLSPQERIFVIAHEYAHEVNGDPRRSALVGTAQPPSFPGLGPGSGSTASSRQRSAASAIVSWLDHETRPPP